MATEYPDFASLITALNNSGEQQKKNALYQTIFLLIKRIVQSQNVTKENFDGILSDLSALLQVTFLTVDDESALLINSRALLAGAGIAFDDTIANRRTINALATQLPVGTVFSTWINANAGTLLGYGTWILFATGVKGPSDDITFHVI